jgi:predicted protein tyrosine phosphatase
MLSVVCGQCSSIAGLAHTAEAQTLRGRLFCYDISFIIEIWKKKMLSKPWQPWLKNTV